MLITIKYSMVDIHVQRVSFGIIIKYYKVDTHV